MTATMSYVDVFGYMGAADYVEAAQLAGITLEEYLEETFNTIYPEGSFDREPVPDFRLMAEQIERDARRHGEPELA
jgi:hypothetical protein